MVGRFGGGLFREEADAGVEFGRGRFPAKGQAEHAFHLEVRSRAGFAQHSSGEMPAGFVGEVAVEKGEDLRGGHRGAALRAGRGHVGSVKGFHHRDDEVAALKLVEAAAAALIFFRRIPFEHVEIAPHLRGQLFKKARAALGEQQAAADGQH